MKVNLKDYMQVRVRLEDPARYGVAPTPLWGSWQYVIFDYTDVAWHMHDPQMYAISMN